MWISILVISAIFIRFNSAEAFVEEVACMSEGFTVILNATDPDVAKLMADPKAQPVVYVYDHKTRVPCGTSLKDNEGGVHLNLTIPYGKACDVLLVKLEPNYQSAETTLVLEDHADTSSRKLMLHHHVFCLYTRSVQTLRHNDVATAHEVVASTGGKPKPRVDMVFRSTDGRPLKAAKFGDTVEFYIALSPDQAYHGIFPKDCRFSDREDTLAPDAKHLTFVQNGCPVDLMSEVIDPLANVNQEVYFSKFRTFRFGNQSTVFAHCTVQVCLDRDECNKSCFKRIPNSNLTAERLRFRHKRSVQDPQVYRNGESMDEVSVTKTLTILDMEESKQMASSSSEPVEKCYVTSASPTLYGLIVLLAVFLLFFVVISIILFYRIRKGRNDKFIPHSAVSLTSLNTGVLPHSYHSHPRHPYVHHLGDNYR